MAFSRHTCSQAVWHTQDSSSSVSIQSAECWFESPVLTLVSLNMTLNNYCSVIRIGHEVAKPVMCNVHKRTKHT